MTLHVRHRERVTGGLNKKWMAAWILMKPILHGQLTGHSALLIVHPMSYKRCYCILLNQLVQVSAQIWSVGAGAMGQPPERGEGGEM